MRGCRDQHACTADRGSFVVQPLRVAAVAVVAVVMAEHAHLIRHRISAVARLGVGRPENRPPAFVQRCSTRRLLRARPLDPSTHLSTFPTHDSADRDVHDSADCWTARASRLPKDAPTSLTRGLPTARIPSRPSTRGQLVATGLTRGSRTEEGQMRQLLAPHSGGTIMALDFVGIDPNSPESKCPAVFVDPETGDFYQQGKVVTDPKVLAEIAKHSPLGADEAVVWQPARMAGVLAEAAAGTYEPGRLGHGEVDLLDLLRGARRSALHLEMRETYDPNHPAFKEFVAGGSGAYEMSSWKKLVSESVARGVKFRRARIVSEPVTQYIRWEHMLTAQNVEAGEDVRWLPRRQAFDLMLPGADLWIIDGRLVAFNFCAGDGTDTGEEEFTSDPDLVARCIATFEQVWERATPHADFVLR